VKTSEITIPTLLRVIFAVMLGAVAIPATAADGGSTEEATFAGGCFWCTEAAFEKVEGVLEVISGYTGGHAPEPTYQQVTTGRTGHTEAVRVIFNPEVVSYEQLLEIFWRNIDPTVENRQFCDTGTQYRAAIFYHDDGQRLAAEKSRAEIERNKSFSEPVVTEITAATAFYTAEDYHQDFYKTNARRYESYRKGCRRDQRLEELWGAEK
jgi:peptide-methionine (S)-S-oxide reductase